MEGQEDFDGEWPHLQQPCLSFPLVTTMLAMSAGGVPIYNVEITMAYVIAN